MNKAFQIDENIYHTENILETLEVFREHWVQEYKDWMLTIQSENENEIQEIFDEFCNYMLFINN
jgi:hypothetical protein